MTRIVSAATAVTWLPREAVDAVRSLPLDVGPTWFDDPPPPLLGDLDALRRANAFREANELHAWIEVEGGAIVAHGYDGRDVVAAAPPSGGSTIAFRTVPLPVRRHEPDVGETRARFSQTAGALIGLPAPRPVAGKPYVHIAPVSAWTTLEVTIHADGRAETALVGASPFPRHSLYDSAGRLVRTTDMLDVAEWYRDSIAGETPWGAERSREFARMVATQLERELGGALLASGASLRRRRLRRGETLVEQGERGEELFLLLVGALDVEVDGVTVAEMGAGAIVGERALLEGGRRTATLRAAMPSLVAAFPGDQVDRTKLAALAESRGGGPPPAP